MPTATGVTSTLEYGDGASPEVFTAIGKIATISGPELSKEEVDDTTLDSPGGFKEFLSGLKDPGQVTFTVHRSPNDQNQEILFSDFAGTARRNFRITWVPLHRLSVNVALSDRRSRLRRLSRETELEGTVERMATGDKDVYAGQRKDLEQAIARLPERARTVLILYDIEGYSHAEIGDIAGMAVGSSKAQLHRARKLVREELEK